jgi:hypothetical protein
MPRSLPDPVPADVVDELTDVYGYTGHGLADGPGAVTGMPDYVRREFTVADGVAHVPALAVRAFLGAYPTAERL